MDDFNNMNSIPSPTPPKNSAPTPTPSNGLATASLVLGILALVVACCGGGLILGPLGIILALLSRGAGNMNAQASAGLGLSIGGTAVSLIAIILYIIFWTLPGHPPTNDQFHNYDAPNGFEGDITEFWDYDEFWDGDEFPFPDFNDRIGDA